LSGWKEIARYLDKGVRTVQRYERDFGLPVRRPAGRPRASVVATKAEMDAWVSASPIREAYQLPPRPVDSLNSPIAQMKRGMAEMVRLRDQMMQLGSEVKASTRVLQENVVDLEQLVRRNSEGSRTGELLSLTGSQTKVDLLMKFAKSTA
jgi:hypothetical protein